jgi:hypothetical protein
MADALQNQNSEPQGPKQISNPVGGPQNWAASKNFAARRQILLAENEKSNLGRFFP